MERSVQDTWTMSSGVVRRPEVRNLVSIDQTPVTPLDSQFGVFPAAFAPAEIAEKLHFSDPDLFAILDGARIQALPEILEGSDLTYRCLYKGQAASELRDVAPYLVRLRADDAMLRHIFTRADSPESWWDTDGFILLQSAAEIDDLTDHFRRLVYIVDDNDVRRMLRFWDARILLALMNAVSENFLDPLLLFGRGAERCVERFILPDPVADTVAIADIYVDSPAGPLICSAAMDQVLRKLARESFALTLVTHCAQRFPQTLSRLKDEQRKEVMLSGIETSHRFNITKRGPVTSFLEMQLVLGCGVSDDPMYPWVQDALGSTTLQNQMAETEALVGKFADYNAKVNGAQNAFFFAALRRAEKRLDMPKETSYPTMLAEVFPQKVAFIGSDTVSVFLKTIQGYVAQRSTMDVANRRAYVLLCFFMGHRCAEDPQYGWVGSNLDRIAQNPSAENSSQLVAKSKIWIKAVLKAEKAP